MKILVVNLTRFGDLLQSQPIISGLADQGHGGLDDPVHQRHHTAADGPEQCDHGGDQTGLRPLATGPAAIEARLGSGFGRGLTGFLLRGLTQVLQPHLAVVHSAA